MLKQKGPLALIILDGFGHSDAREGNAVALAQMPFYDELREKYPHTLIEASGTCVGLPGGIMGNSEVGHLNMGAGRVIMTDIRRIDYSVETGEFFQNVAFVTALDNAKARGGAVHLMGLLSDGLVHSSQEHLYALLRLAKERGLARAYVHCFLDGRDTPPSSAHLYVKALQDRIAETGFGEIATVCGRYYAMDRDNRWERTKRAYDMLVSGVGERADDPPAAVRRSYERGVTDEFVEPAVITGADGSPTATIRDGDAVIFFNFRADRARQLTRALAVEDFEGFPVPDRPRVDYVCFTLYDQTFGLPVAFPQLRHRNILAEVFAAVGVRNYRLAETEKYAHVTYFFNGGTELEYPSERRLLVPSPKVATYDLMPEMAAFKVTDKILRGIDERDTDVFIVNFANPDMVGHTGSIPAAVRAVEAVDTRLGPVVDAVHGVGGVCLVTADHGNAEVMLEADGESPHTAHTMSPVPLVVTAPGLRLREGGELSDVVPTALHLLGKNPPAAIRGKNLLRNGVSAS